MYRMGHIRVSCDVHIRLLTTCFSGYPYRLYRCRLNTESDTTSDLVHCLRAARCLCLPNLRLLHPRSKRMTGRVNEESGISLGNDPYVSNAGSTSVVSSPMSGRRFWAVGSLPCERAIIASRTRCPA